MMIHLSQYFYDAHEHATVAEARACEQDAARDAAEAAAEQWAESAWLRAAEYDPRVREETEREEAMALALR